LSQRSPGIGDAVSQLVSGQAPRVCLVTTRLAAQQVFRSGWYEAEDVLIGSNDVEVIAAERAASPSARHLEWKLRRLFTHDRIRRQTLVDPGVRPISLHGDYDLFVLACPQPGDAFIVNAVADRRKRCKVSVCWLGELWTHSLPGHQKWLPLLREFDVVAIAQRDSVEPASEAIGKQCHYVPPGVDVLRFAPADPMPRTVDVYSLGRRAEPIHLALLQLTASSSPLFYVYDTIRNAANTTTLSYREHRELIANIAKRSRFFTVAPAYFTDPAKIGGQMEIGPRFYEGAAAGAVLLGTGLPGDALRDQFDWPDAVVAVQPDGSDVGTVMARLNGSPGEVERISRRNIAETALRHDWVYRWKELMHLAGLPVSAGMIEREQRLRTLAKHASSTTVARAYSDHDDRCPGTM